MTDEARKSRWLAALHEAGHLVAAALLGRRVVEAQVDAEGQGVADYENTTGSDEMLIVAAGRAAESVLGHLAPPPEKPCTSSDRPTSTPEPALLACPAFRSLTADDTCLARLAMQGHEIECLTDASIIPLRVARARLHAEQTIAAYRRPALMVAIQLYRRGRLDEDQLQALLPPAEPAQHTEGSN